MRVCWLFSCCLSVPNSPFTLGFVMLGPKVPFAAGPLSGLPTGGAAGELASWRRRDLISGQLAGPSAMILPAGSSSSWFRFPAMSHTCRISHLERPQRWPPSELLYSNNPCLSWGFPQPQAQTMAASCTYDPCYSNVPYLPFLSSSTYLTTSLC